MNNRSMLFVSLFMASLSVTSTSTHAADRANTDLLHSVSLGSDLVRIALTNIAIKNPTKAPVLHAAAATAGIAGNVALMKLLQANPNIGDQFAVGSSMGANLIDLVTHLTNANRSAQYQTVATANLVGIRSAQLLEVVANYLANYAPTEICKTAEFQTVMHNVHASLEALEKLLLTSSYEPALINKGILEVLLAASILANTGSADYYGMLITQAPTPPVVENPVAGPLQNQVVNPAPAPLQNQPPADQEQQLAIDPLIAQLDVEAIAAQLAEEERLENIRRREEAETAQAIQQVNNAVRRDEVEQQNIEYNLALIEDAQRREEAAQRAALEQARLNDLAIQQEIAAAAAQRQIIEDNARREFMQTPLGKELRGLRFVIINDNNRKTIEARKAELQQMCNDAIAAAINTRDND